MSQTSSNNKRIAKNTLLLYFRMFVMAVIGLFTSRVILQTLGVEDFGIYNVVGGIVAMMGILNSSMSVSTQRYLTFELGKGEENFPQLHKTFCISFNIFVGLSLVFIFLAETVGLWFLNTQLVIPPERMTAANWVYQFSVISVVNSLMMNPYNAIIIAHEKMDVYAYLSIVEVVLKLGIVYLLTIVPFDRLITYGFLFLLLSLFITMLYRFYCIRHFKESKYHYVSDKQMYKELASYSGWNLFGSGAALFKGQGLNILLNMFFNPSVNAARGIAYQINTHITLFFTNFYTAVRPQITKYYAQNELDNMFKLVFRSSKMAFFLIFLVALPIVVEAPYIVELWLGQLPEYVVPFVRLIVVISAVDAMANPLMTTAHATGRIALYQSTVGTMVMMNIPVSYFLLSYYGCGPVVVFVVSLVISVICLFMRLWIVKRLVNFPVLRYIKEVFGSCLLVAALSLVVPLLLYLQMEVNFLSVCIVCLACLICSCGSVFFIGLTKTERTTVLDMIKKKVFHKNDTAGS